MLDITEKKAMEAELHEHRYRFARNVEQRTEQLMRRIALLESCNATLCDKLALAKSESAAHKPVGSLRAPAKDRSAASDASLDKLSLREREILIMLPCGHSNKEIAGALHLAESTVKIHVQGILRKLNLAGRVQAAVYAAEHGLIADECRLG
ncbi:MAG: hypothetical protein A2Z95_10250 [Gallionellales bacterium GWA2_60_18]|nr:MAG: hypothetical protein A2Z95_10250 [Gallionellales bacterium GWA2_60_18]